MDFEHETINSNKDISVKFQYFKDNGSEISKHWHRSLEIIYLITGKLEVNINGVDYSLNENDIIVINTLEIHSTICKYGNTAIVLRYLISFAKTILIIYLQQNSFVTQPLLMKKKYFP